jgi:hypothetical protein
MVTTARASKGMQEGRAHQAEPRPFSHYGAFIREALLFAQHACGLKLRSKAIQLESADIVPNRGIKLASKEVPGPRVRRGRMLN